MFRIGPAGEKGLGPRSLVRSNDLGRQESSDVGGAPTSSAHQHAGRSAAGTMARKCANVNGTIMTSTIAWQPRFATTPRRVSNAFDP